MNRPLTANTYLRIAIYPAAVAMVLYLALVAAYPSLLDRVHPITGWFGTSGSVATIVIACATIGVACLAGWRTGSGQRSVGRPLGVTLALTAVSAILGFSSYLWCHDAAHPRFITSLLWTGGVMRGGLDDRRTAPGMELCPAHAPVALDIAKVAALAALLVGIAGIANALLESRLDRFRLRFDSSITAIVGTDDEADSMVAAVERTLEKNSHLLLVTTAADAEHRAELRRRGGRVVAVDFTRPDALRSLPIWQKVTRLYLLAADPNTNLQRLRDINGCLPSGRNRRPLTVRIDDPWQAEAWRARQLGGSDTRWAGDAIGKYEVTAHRLLDQVIGDEQVNSIVVCGTTPLTLALCANLSRRRLERDFYSDPADSPPPTLTIVGEGAEDYRQNQEIHLAQRGLPTAREWLTAVPEQPTASSLAALVRYALNGRPSGAAVIITGGDPMLGTMLAARLPEIPVYAFAADAPENLDFPAIVGRLRTYRLSMDLPAGHSQDVWERAAKLIHNRYVAHFGGTSAGTSPAARPWEQLDEFYRGSNRRQVRNALWMIEQIAGRTWDSASTDDDSIGVGAYAEAEPLDRLSRLGIDREAALAMAEAEHRDWCRYYREAGWRYGPVRDDVAKIHDGLVDWSGIEGDPEALNRALNALAATLSALSELGYRSRPKWQQFRRTGTVVATRRTDGWSWTAASGQPMHAAPGDWEVRGESGDTWSVRDDIFRSTHRQLDAMRWRRTGVVQARRARAGEVIETLEGPLVAQAGDWIVRGPTGEQWPVRPEAFEQQYRSDAAEVSAR